MVSPMTLSRIRVTTESTMMAILLLIWAMRTVITSQELGNFLATTTQPTGSVLAMTGVISL